MVTTVAGAAWAAAGKADTKPAARITDAATRCQRPAIPFSLVIESLLHRRVSQWWRWRAIRLALGQPPRLCCARTAMAGAALASRLPGLRSCPAPLGVYLAHTGPPAPRPPQTPLHL